MARIAGVDIPKNERVEIGLTRIFGIGRSLSDKILKETGRTLSSFKDIMIRYPQISRNIKVRIKLVF